jgi:hypothetical protein
MGDGERGADQRSFGADLASRVVDPETTPCFWLESWGAEVELVRALGVMTARARVVPTPVPTSSPRNEN